MISGIATSECALGVLRGEGIAPLPSPPRRVLVVVDAVLVISILWLLAAPIRPLIGPSSGYSEGPTSTARCASRRARAPRSTPCRGRG